MCFLLPKGFLFFKNQLAVYTFEILLYFQYRYVIRPWNQKLISVAVGVVAVQVNHKHENLLYHFLPVITCT